MTVESFSIFGYKEYNQSDFGIDHLGMSICRVVSCIVGRGCLLWLAHSLGKSASFWAYLIAQLTVCLQCRRPGFDFWVRKIPGEGNGNPLQYSCLENPIDRRVWWAIVHGVARVRQLKWLNQHHHCFILYSKAKFACYSRYLLSSYFYIPVPSDERDISFWC